MNQLLSDLKEAISRDVPPEETAQQRSRERREGEKGFLNCFKTESQKVKPLALKIDLCYIVSAVIIKDGKVLMMKEAKKSCRGRWYLPAGRLEKDESLVEGVKREVHEETGLLFEPTSLVCVDDSITLSWQRFNFTGIVTGGKLKTLQDADKESMEAGWFEPEAIFSHSIPLRALDVIPLIKSTIRWKAMKERDPSFICLPVPIPHDRMVIQLVLVAHDENDGMKVCLDKKNGWGFLHSIPSTLCCSVRSVVRHIIVTVLGNEEDYQLHDILSVEHVGKPHGVADGVCFTLLTEVPVPVKVSNPSRYVWFDVAEERLKARIKELLEKRCVELVLR